MPSPHSQSSFPTACLLANILKRRERPDPPRLHKAGKRDRSQTAYRNQQNPFEPANSLGSRYSAIAKLRPCSRTVAVENLLCGSKNSFRGYKARVFHPAGAKVHKPASRPSRNWLSPLAHFLRVGLPSPSIPLPLNGRGKVTPLLPLKARRKWLGMEAGLQHYSPFALPSVYGFQSFGTRPYTAEKGGSSAWLNKK